MSVTDEVKARLDIVDVISDTVSLKKSGRNHVGFCPFHSNTRTPSLVVFSETQTWRCFGACAEGGDVYSFVMKREGLDFKEALETLARRAGVQLKQPTPRATEQEAERRKLLEINTAAADYFHQLLTTSPAGASTRAYLAEREISDETIATFQLGYALDQWEALKSHLTERGYSGQELLAAGLIVERDDGSPGYDRFRNRLIIPIRDSRGRVIGFGARALATDQMPKYLNSPQTMLFDKSATLYGLDLARKHIRQAAEVVIVEGYMDVIQAHQRDAGNVVAQMGTALTEPQLKSVASLADKIVLALDADTAGNAATVRAISVARQALPKKTRAALTSRGAVAYEAHIAQGIYIATLPPGKDPDDILREGLEVWQELIATATPALDFYESLIIGQADMTTPQGKSFVVGELIPLYRDIENNIEKVARVQRLARRLGLDERLLMAELKGGQSGARASRRHRQPPTPPEPSAELKKPAALSIEKLAWGEEYCLALILVNPTALAMANEMLEKQGLSGLTAHDFKRGDHKEIFKQVQLWTASESPKIETLIETVGEPLEQRLATLASYGYRRPPTELENINLDLTLAILRLRHQNISEQIKELQLLQHEASDNQDLDSNRRYTEMVEQYKQQRQKIDTSRDALSLMGQRRLEANQYGEFI
jgi:DNA primase